MMLKYFHGFDEDQLAAQGPIAFDHDDGWWAGIQKCAATLALSAVLTLASFAAVQAQTQATGFNHQDDPVSSLHGQPEEDFWQNPVAPAPLSFNKIYLPDPEDFPANSVLGFTLEDEPWQHKLYSPHLKVYDTTSGGQLILSGDEDFWQNPVLPVPSTNYVPQPFLERDDAPVGFLFGPPDEDYWANSILPVSNPSIWPQQFAFDDQNPAGSLALVAEEDYWQNWVAPIFAYPVPIIFSDPNDTVLSTLSISPDEDYWQRRIKIPDHKVYGRGGGSRANTPDEDSWSQTLSLDIPNYITLWMDDDASIPQPLSFDEDFWQNSVLPVPSYPVPHAFSDDEIIVPNVIVVALPFDEELWNSWVAPVASYPVPISFRDDDIWVPNVVITSIPFDEEPWQPQIGLDQNLKVTLWTDDTAVVPIPSLAPDEDFNQRLVPPVPAANLQLMQFTFDEQIPAGFLMGSPDEDYWINPVPPTSLTFGQLYLPDGDEDQPTGTLEGDFDEDFWINPVLPVPDRNYIQLPLLSDPEEIPVGTLIGVPEEEPYQQQVPPSPVFPVWYWIDDETPATFAGQPDEDYWVNPVPPVPSYPVPLVFRDMDEIPVGNLFGIFEDDSWMNPVLPVPSTLGKLYLPDMDEDQPVGTLFVKPDEDYWINSVRPFVYPPPPIVFVDDEIIGPRPPLPTEEEFWNNPILPIAATLRIAFPYLPDAEEIPAGHLIPPPPPPPPLPGCPCSGTPNIPKDKVYDIVLCPISRGIWWACIFAQPGSNLAKRMNQNPTVIYVYGTQQQAFAEARQYVSHELGF